MRKPLASQPADYATFAAGIRDLLDAARRASARAVNRLMTATYWEIGRRIVEQEQGGRSNAGYGEELLKRLSADLAGRFGRGFSVQNLEYMRLFYRTHDLAWISQTLSGKSLSEDHSRKRGVGEQNHDPCFRPCRPLFEGAGG